MAPVTFGAMMAILAALGGLIDRPEPASRRSRPSRMPVPSGARSSSDASVCDLTDQTLAVSAERMSGDGSQ
jgi:hypothetical protein